MGPQIVVSGITSSTDKALYLPIICPLITSDLIQKIIFQSVQTSGSKFINNNNLVFNKSNYLFGFTLGKKGAITSDGSNIKTQFPKYSDQTADIEFNNIENNLEEHKNVLGLILLSNGLN